MTKTLRIAVTILAIVAWGTVAEAQGPLTQVSALALGTRAHDLVVRQEGQRLLAYVATDVGLTIVDVTNPAAPARLGSAKTGAKVLGIALKDSHAYLASVAPDFAVVDVSDSTAPKVVATRLLPGSAWDVAVKDDVAYVASFAGEVWLFRISNPANPQQIKSIGLPAWRTTSGDTAALAKLNSY